MLCSNMPAKSSAPPPTRWSCLSSVINCTPPGFKISSPPLPRERPAYRLGAGSSRSCARADRLQHARDDLGGRERTGVDDDGVIGRTEWRIVPLPVATIACVDVRTGRGEVGRGAGTGIGVPPARALVGAGGDEEFAIGVREYDRPDVAAVH